MPVLVTVKMRIIIGIFVVFYFLREIVLTYPNGEKTIDPNEDAQQFLNESSELESEEIFDDLRNDFDPNDIKIVKLPNYGVLKGSLGATKWTNRTIYQFLGVKYAESPNGNRRFKAPVPVRSWRGVRNVENFGRKCPTLADLNASPENERKNRRLEDCLNMAIYSTNVRK